MNDLVKKIKTPEPVLRILPGDAAAHERLYKKYQKLQMPIMEVPSQTSAYILTSEYFLLINLFS